MSDDSPPDNSPTWTALVRRDLDEQSVGMHLLREVQDVTGFSRGCLLRIDSDGRLTSTAVLGFEDAEWSGVDRLLELDLGDLVDTEGLTTQSEEMVVSHVVAKLGQTDSTSQDHRIYLPVSLSNRLFAILYAEGNEQFSDEQRAAASEVVARSAALLGAAELVTEIHRSAIAEERQRLAREIHDGIAQELAGLAYLVEDIEVRTEQPRLREEIEFLRGQLTKIVSELRLSIFELRSSIDHEEGLGHAITSYSREVGSRAGLTVHLVLQESDVRMPAHVESEVMRIVQGAVNNVVRHAQARNMWVHLRTAPPQATLLVADDGVGLGDGRSDSFGLQIMRERAARIGGTIDVGERLGGGTVVEMSIGANADHGTSARGRTE